MLLGKTKFSTIEVLISKALIDSNIRHDKFISVNKVLREYNEIKEEKILKLPSISYRKSIEPIASVVKNILETKIQVLENKRTKQINTFAICGKKEWTFIKNQELHSFNNMSNDQFKINKIINKFLLSGDKFMTEFHLKQPGFNCSASANIY